MSNNPERNLRDMRVELTTSRGSGDPADTDRVVLEVRDDASGELLAGVRIPTAEWWRLCQGGTARVAGIVSPHLDRVGKRMLNARVELPDALPEDTDKDVERDVWRAVHDQLAEEWWSFDSYDTPRIQGGGTQRRYTIVRRWVEQ